MGPDHGCAGRRSWRGGADDRSLRRARTPTRSLHRGRSRGGLTSKIHAVVDRNGLPVHLALTPGEAHDNRWCSVLLSALLPQTMLPADRVYDAHWIRVARLACRTPAKLSGNPDTGKVEAALLYLLRVEGGLFGLQISYQFFCSIY